MSQSGREPPSITFVRESIRSVVEAEANSLRARHVAVLGIDGIPYELARRWWRSATTVRMRSVFPTTSSSAWLSSLTGLTVGAHGVPGVIFRLGDDNEEPINVFNYNEPLGTAEAGNIFSDAAALGYRPLAIVGDLQPYDCSWRDLVLRDSERIGGHQFYTAETSSYRPPDPQEVIACLEKVIRGSVATNGCAVPCFLWCFVEVDKHVHYYGYDEHVMSLLQAIDAMAVSLMEQGIRVIAHSDHGLTPTRHSTAIAGVLQDVSSRYGCALGGAGRTRWLYASPAARDRCRNDLADALPGSVRICAADEMFPRASLARSRVGDVVLIAEGPDFLTSDGYCFDHGSVTRDEIDVPFSDWSS